MLTYHVPDKRTAERYNLLLEVRFNPPAEIYVQGSVSTNARAVIMGSNREQFWLALSPEEISSYYLGRMEEVRDFEGQVIGMSPQVVLEAFGIVAEPNGESDAAPGRCRTRDPTTFSPAGTRPGGRSNVCTSTRATTAYTRSSTSTAGARSIAVAQLGDYEPVGGGVPRADPDADRLHGPRRAEGLHGDRAQGPRTTTEFNERQRETFFTPPDADKFDNIYRYEAGQWLLQ